MKGRHAMVEKSFDYWKNLFSSNPTEFEKQRKQELMDVVEKTYEEDKGKYTDERREERYRNGIAFLHGMEQRLQKYNTPLARYNAMVSLFYDKAIQNMDIVIECLQEENLENLKKADVIPIKKVTKSVDKK